MLTGLEFLYCYNDKSSLFRAWEKYYDRMGLAHNKRNKKVIERVQKGKFPSKIKHT